MTICGWIVSSCSTALVGGIEWKNLMAFFATERHDHFHHCRFVVDNYDFGHIRKAENISSLRSRNAGTRKSLGRARGAGLFRQSSSTRPDLHGQILSKASISTVQLKLQSSPQENRARFGQASGCTQRLAEFVVTIWKISSGDSAGCDLWSFRISANKLRSPLLARLSVPRQMLNPRLPNLRERKSECPK